MKKAACVAFVVWMVCLSTAAGAPQSVPEGRVEVAGKTLFVLHSGVGSFSPAERAVAVNDRLRAILASPPAKIQTRVEKSDLGLQIMIGDKPIISVTGADAQAEKASADALAARWSKALQEGLSQAGSAKAWRTLLRHVLITLLVLTVAVLGVFLLYRGRAWLVGFLEARRERIPTLRFRGLVMVRNKSIYQFLLRALALLYYLSYLVIGVAALLLVFAQFPATRTYAHTVFLWTWEPLTKIFWGVVNYLPNLFYILVIIVVTRFVIRGLTFIFEQAHRGVISLEPWIHQDVARPTSQIIKAILVILALFFIAPLVPGTGSTAAKGISVILGLMVSFGSSSTVGNLIAGMVLTYMRPFKIGDRVKLGETVGDVVERTFLYTKVITIKNEEIIVPSLQALSGALINYSARAKEEGLVLHTSVTIGYDTPWRKVHELLLRAADRTHHVLKTPPPFVLQTSLSDFYVSYQLNVYTDAANQMANIYAELHQNIQDSFNEGGIEIMSPHYFQLRDGNTAAIPASYRGADYVPGRFRVDARTVAEKA
jgi:small-conductance mechanosensitive channel